MRSPVLDNFDRYSVGLLNGQGGWADLDATEFSVVNVNGNMMVGANTGDAMAVLRLGPLAVNEGQQATLFFRVYQTGDTYSIYVAKDGTAQRTTILTDYISARGQGQADIGFATIDLDKLIIGGLNGTSTTTNLFFDDIYLSKAGFNSTVPRAFGFTTPVSGEPPTLSIAAVAGQVQITWSAGTLQSAATITGAWTDVSGAASPYKVSPEGTQRFHRVRQ